METIFNKAQHTLEENGWHREAFQRPEWRDEKYRITNTRWGTREVAWDNYERDLGAWHNRDRRRVATRGAVLGFPHSYAGDALVDFCMRGAMGESAMLYPLGFPHPFKMAFANKVSRRVNGCTVLRFNDRYCRSQSQAVAFLGECDRQWRQRGLRKYWQRYLGTGVHGRLRQFGQWTNSGPSYSFNGAETWRNTSMVSATKPVTVPDGLIDGWPPDQVPTTWVQEESLV